jgi:hypothetical protein
MGRTYQITATASTALMVEAAVPALLPPSLGMSQLGCGPNGIRSNLHNSSARFHCALIEE